jgi:hypothetical protein
MTDFLSTLDHPTKEQEDFYTSGLMKPMYHRYMGMGHFWVICQSIEDPNNYYLTVLGGPNSIQRNENREQHLALKSSDIKWMNIEDCLSKLKTEISNW